MSWKRMLPALVIVLASGLVAAGCGGDDDGGDSEAPIEVLTEVPTNAEELEEAQDEAEQSVSEAFEEAAPEAQEQCREGAEQLDGAAREQALEICENLPGG